MKLELDHIFVCTAPEAPEAERLITLGFNEGPPSVHAGQGTANRRFAFSNAMIEFLWVHESAEAQNETTGRTMLWERWSGRGERVCPFGICVRPIDGDDAGAVFSGWDYRPAYLPWPLSMHIGEAGIEEPMWVYLSFLRRSQRLHWFREHPAGVREITGVTLYSPVPLRSDAAQRLIDAGVIRATGSGAYGLEIEFDYSSKKQRIDLRPDLPLILSL